MATNTNSFTGMFEDLGIDTRTQEQILAKRARDNEEKANTAPEGAEPFAGAHDLRRGGRILGNIIRKKFHKPQLSEQEQASVDAVAEAQTKFEERRDNGDFLGKDGKPDLIMESDGFNRAVAGSLLKIGDPRGMELAKRLDEDVRARAKDTQERVLGGLEIISLTQENTSALYDHERGMMLDIRGEFLPIYMKDSTDPNSGFGAHIKDDGTAESLNGTIFELGTYTPERPKEPKLTKGGFVKPLRPQDFGWSSTNVGKVQENMRNLLGQYDMAVALRDALASAVGPDGTLNIMGSAGKIEKGIAGFVTNMQSLGRAFSKTLQIEDSEGNFTAFDGSVSSSARYARENQHLFEGMAIPDSIVGDKGKIARYQGIIVQFAYGTARMNEDSGRITDTDFDHAITQIGAAATDPRELQEIMVGNLGRAGRKLEIWRDMMPPGLEPLIFPPKSLDTFNAAKENFELAFGRDFGLSKEAGPGLLEPQGIPRDFLDTIDSGSGFTPSEDAEISKQEAELARLEAEFQALDRTKGE